jgi:hypothetical protein
MNSYFRAMRMAMSESYRTGEGVYGGSARQARGSATVLIVEDRLSVSAGDPFGTRDRSPFTASGRGTFSKALYYSLDPDEYDDSAAIFDVLVNGQRFPFTTNGVISIRLSNDDGSQPAWAPTCVWSGNWVVTQFPSASQPTPVPGGACWEPRCINEQGTTLQPTAACIAFNGGDCAGCEAAGIGPPACNVVPFNEDRGCMVMFKKAANCRKGCDDWNGGAAERFDLDFDGTNDVDVADRPDFAWQWVPVAGLLDGASGLAGTTSWSIILPVSAQGMRLPNRDSSQKALNLVLDVDGDWSEESVVDIAVQTENVAGSLYTASYVAQDPVIRSVLMVDSNEGDLDFTTDDRSDWVRIQQGLPVLSSFALLDDIKMYSFTEPGTLLEIREGQLFAPSTGQLVRDTSLTDHVDIIQRVLRVNRDTQRFCDASDVPRATVSALANPVEACGNCFGEAGAVGDNDSVANVEQTCFDGDIRMLFIRSRLQDLRGRRWVTRFDA